MKLANEDLEPGIYGGSVTALKGLGRMFYVIDPDETSYKTTQQVPNFIQQVRSVISIDMCISLSEGILFSKYANISLARGKIFLFACYFVSDLMFGCMSLEIDP